VHTHTITNTYNATDWQTDTTSDGLLTRYGYDAAGPAAHAHHRGRHDAGDKHPRRGGAHHRHRRENGCKFSGYMGGVHAWSGIFRHAHWATFVRIGGPIRAFRHDR